MLQQEQDILLNQPDIINAFTEYDNAGVPVPFKEALLHAETLTGNRYPSGSNREFIAIVVMYLMNVLRDTLNEKPATTKGGWLVRLLLNLGLERLVLRKYRER